MKNEKTILEIIRSDLQREGYEPELLQEDGTDSLAFVLPLLRDNGGKVMMELFFRPVTEKMSRLVFLTLLIHDHPEGMDELAKALPQWNLEAEIGTYVMLREGAQLYHKYDLLAAEDDPPLEIGLQTQRVLYTVSQELVEHLGVIRALATGRMTLEQAKKKGYC
ncbi:MAG: hypothetical protein ACI4LE_03885 [Faecalibacterium sp.]